MATKQAIVRQVAGQTLLGKAGSNHWVALDSPEAAGGAGAGTSPKELVLVALGGCTAMDVISILRKKRAPVTDVVVNLTGTERDEHPRIFTEIHVEYVIRGDGIKPADVEHAIRLSTTTYCSVSAMLRDTVKLTHSYRIEETAHAQTSG
jgi:putative redox protein